MYTGKPFHCYILDECICHFRVFYWVYCFAFILFLMEKYVVSDLGLHCLPKTLFGFPGKKRLKERTCSYGSKFFLLTEDSH